MFSNFLKSGYGINPLSEQQAVIVMLANEVQIPGVSMTVRMLEEYRRA